MFIKSTLTFLMLLLSFLSFGQVEKARRVTEVLCSDSLYGRGYVNNGVNKAADFLRDEFEKAGLKPYFGDSSYFQPFSFNVNTFPGIIEVNIDGKPLVPGVDFLVGESSGSFNGELNLIEVDTSVLSNHRLLDPMVEKVRVGEYNGFYINLSDMSVQEAYSAVYQFNALAIIGAVVYETDQKFTWSVGRKQLQFPILHIKEGKINPKSKIKVEIEAEFIKNFESKNVVGVIPAKKKKAKTIVFTAHYDHLGGMGTSPQTYFPGANDNASGTAMLISMADHFINNPSEYNMVFIAFAGEEAGLLGSEYFVKSKSLDFSKIKFLLNLDIMGSGEEGITAVNGRLLEKEFELLKCINDKQEYLSTVKSRGETANSDHYHFHVKGVPSFFIYTMGPNKNYHDVHDTYEELSFAAYDNIVKLLVEFIEKL
ncbi:M28 family metallopeptidase [Brumimicrobium sp.]|uniref:M28 family metallopeptidase n=1 Tax=Brumimicrobium sp. TaxID=2029867 RepID=UPI003A90FCB8